MTDPREAFYGAWRLVANTFRDEAAAAAGRPHAYRRTGPEAGGESELTRVQRRAVLL